MTQDKLSPKYSGRFNATFLDSFFVGKNHQLKALFAIREEGKRTLQVLVDAPWVQEKQPMLGSPYTLALGDDAKGVKVLSLQERQDGQLWDSLEWITAIIDNINPVKNSGSFFISRNLYALIPKHLYEEAAKLGIGHPVKISVAYNTVKERYGVWQMKSIDEIPESSEIKLCMGYLDIHHKGFAFCEDVFVSPALVKSVSEDNEVEMLCVYKKKPDQVGYGWIALTIKEKYNGLGH